MFECFTGLSLLTKRSQCSQPSSRACASSSCRDSGHCNLRYSMCQQYITTSTTIKEPFRYSLGPIMVHCPRRVSTRHHPSIYLILPCDRLLAPRTFDVATPCPAFPVKTQIFWLPGSLQALAARKSHKCREAHKVLRSNAES